jgi:hypothetical protein
MKLSNRFLIGAAVGGLAAGAAFAQTQPTTGPVAVYWMSAATTSGMGGMGGMPGASGFGGPGGGGPPAQAQPQPQRRPGFGAMMGMALGRGGPPAGAYGGGAGGYPGARGMPPGMGGGAGHTLTLQLGSRQKPDGQAEGEHLPPAGLQAGDSLPLVTPQVAPPEPAEPGGPPQMTQRPRGRMLIYWGCGEHAPAPIVIDFSKIGPGMPMPNIPFVTANPGRPPSAGRYPTYGDWPNQLARTTVPADGSLVGAHTVRSSYSPEIHFSLGPNQDFLPPLTITGNDKLPSGATRVSWDPVAGATGYYAWMFGAQDRGETVVVWSSGASANMMGALTDYLPPSEVRRLIAQNMVMSPQTTQCVVPAEVVQAAQFGMLSMIAYGEESDFAYPPRPHDPKAAWNIKWTVKVRRKSTTGAILGMPAGARGF